MTWHRHLNLEVAWMLRISLRGYITRISRIKIDVDINWRFWCVILRRRWGRRFRSINPSLSLLFDNLRMLCHHHSMDDWDCFLSSFLKDWAHLFHVVHFHFMQREDRYRVVLLTHQLRSSFR